MRLIVKQSMAPESYVSFLTHNNPRDWDKDVPAEMKKFVRENVLAVEQFMYSAYTEKRLGFDDKGLHVDHFRKQSLFPSPKFVFDWNNFFVDKHEVFYGADFKDNGKSSPVKSVPDYDCIINPSEEAPHHYFCYSADGCICARSGLTIDERKRAIFTIAAFNLCHPSLVAERSSIFAMVTDMKNGGCTPQEILDCLSGNSYPSVVEYCCNEIFDEL